MPAQIDAHARRFQAPLAAGRSVASWDDLQNQAITLIEKELRSALKSPLEFPPIETAIIPDDHVCIAVEPGLPRMTTIVVSLIEYLIDHGALLRNISVLAGDAECCEALRVAASPPSRLAGLEIVMHDGSEDAHLGFLATAKNGSPIALSRELIDADVVIPICLAKSDQRQWQSQIEFLYPHFSDVLTVQRFERQTTEVKYNPAKDHPNLIEAQEAMRWLGVYLTVQVEPGPGDSVMRFVAGERNKAIPAASDSSRQSWHRTIDQPCDLVITSSDFANEARSWEELLATITRFAPVLQSEGAMVVSARFSTAKETDSSGATMLNNAPSMNRATRKQFNSLLENLHIYLISDLSREATEESGLGYVATGEEIERLAESFERCLFVPHPNRCSVSPGKSK